MSFFHRRQCVSAMFLLVGSVSYGRGSQPKGSECSSAKAERYLATQQYSAAIAEIEKFLAACEPSSLMYERLGFAYYYIGESEKALQALRRAKDWRAAELHILVAEGEHRAGRHTVELTEAQEAIASTPYNTKAQVVLRRACKENMNRSGPRARIQGFLSSMVRRFSMLCSKDLGRSC